MSRKLARTREGSPHAGRTFPNFLKALLQIKRLNSKKLRKQLSKCQKVLQFGRLASLRDNPKIFTLKHEKVTRYPLSCTRAMDIVFKDSVTVSPEKQIYSIYVI